MIVTELDLPGAFLIQPERLVDERGYFARIFCADELGRHGLDTRICQSSISHNQRPGTLRGLHWQDPPHAEAKYVQCVRGRIFDVIVDLKVDSPTQRQWTATELSASNGHILYVPEEFAHGFQTLEDDCDVLYQITAPYRPDAARGARWDDPALNIRWPYARPSVISQRDLGFPLMR
jgi:dTDP-4-dehydrorhamnose 3,5-epimerase